MKTFLINLEKNVDRLAFARDQLQLLGLEFERFPGVYGAALSEEEKRRAVDRFRWWCAVGIPPRDGEVGCGLSHLGVCHRMVEENIPYACVLEDDVVLKSAAVETLATIERWYRAGNQGVVLLSNHTRRDLGVTDKTILQEDKIRILSGSDDYFTEAYCLTRIDAEVILRANEPLQVPIDHWGRWRKHWGLPVYHIWPTLAEQEASGRFATDVFTKVTVTRNLGHLIRRGIGRAIDGALLRMGR